MKIETYIDSLVSYAMNKGLALPYEPSCPAELRSSGLWKR